MAKNPTRTVFENLASTNHNFEGWTFYANNMAKSSNMRMLRELRDWQDEETDVGIKLEKVGDSLSRFRGSIRGPPDTPYVNGTFVLDIEITEHYPFRPPKVRFVTRVWHPNISSVTGAICLDLLRDQWAATMTIRTVLLSIQSLLSDPKPNDPQDAVVASQYLNHNEIYKLTARYWSHHFAKAPDPKIPDYTAKITTLHEMGYTAEQAIEALSHCDWAVDNAVQRLCGK
uniref:E2 ubiquitin-conjugating enzyme n=1 Tax=Romanomermis culicivorax TaxID=13658 RepID=A0A915KSV2_ROMCU